jgi:DNA-binding transcriptional regulator GbsR (MarR family)
MDDHLRDHLSNFERFFETIGFKPRLGRVWGLLTLAGKPLSSAEIAGELSMSIGSTSECLTELREWGAIKSEFSPTHRCQLHTAISDTMSIVATVLRRREQVAIARFKESMAQALEYVNNVYGPSDPRATVLQSIVGTSEIAEAAIQFFVSASSGQTQDPNSRFNRFVRRMLEFGLRVPGELTRQAQRAKAAITGKKTE